MLSERACADNSELLCLRSILSHCRPTLYPLDPQKSARGTLPGDKVMKLVQLIVAASILIPAASSFAQSTPVAVNEAVRSQLVQEETTYRSLDASDKQQASINNVNRSGERSRQTAEVNLGRYSLSVVRPSF